MKRFVTFTPMVIHQLDLFGNPVAIPITKEEPKAPASPKQESPKEDLTPKSLPLFEEKETNTVAEAEPVVEEAIVSNETEGETKEPETQNEVVYSDDQIRVKLKRGPKKKIPSEKTGRSGRFSNTEVDDYVDLVNVPDDETLNKKLYYKISIVADWFGVNASMIRYWENEFDILKPRLGRKGDRYFRVEDVKNLQLIYHLLKVRKFSIEGAKDYLKGNKQKVDAHREIAESLGKVREFLTDLKATLGV